MNNPLLFNAAFSGIAGGCDAERWITNGADLNLNQAIQAASLAIDSFIPPIVGGATASQSKLLQSICEGIFSSRYLQDTNPLSYTVIAQSIANNFNAAQLNLVPVIPPIPSGVLHEIRYTITNAATQDSTTLIPGIAQVVLARLIVTIPYSSGATISIGQMGSIALLQATTDNLATVANTYNVEQDTAWGGIDLAIRTTINGTPAAGAGFVIVFYCVPNG